MATQYAVTYTDMLRSLPVECLLVTAVPVVLAGVQLTNSLINGLSGFVSVPFALVMILFAVVLTQHQFAQFRRRHFERTLQLPSAE